MTYFTYMHLLLAGNDTVPISMWRMYALCRVPSSSGVSASTTLGRTFSEGLRIPVTKRFWRIVKPNKSSAVAVMGHRLATIHTGRKVGGYCAPFRGREAGSPSNTMSSGPRPISVPSGILIHLTVCPQYNNVTDRQDRQDNGLVV